MSRAGMMPCDPQSIGNGFVIPLYDLHASFCPHTCYESMTTANLLKVHYPLHYYVCSSLLGVGNNNRLQRLSERFSKGQTPCIRDFAKEFSS